VLTEPNTLAWFGKNVQEKKNRKRKK